jgi:hypothetical protein
VSSASVSGTGAASKRPVAIALATVGVIAVVIGVLYFTVKGLPTFMTAGSAHTKNHTHALRGGTSLAVGVLLFIGAWWFSRKPGAAR